MPSSYWFLKPNISLHCTLKKLHESLNGGTALQGSAHCQQSHCRAAFEMHREATCAFQMQCVIL